MAQGKRRQREVAAPAAAAKSAPTPGVTAPTRVLRQVIVVFLLALAVRGVHFYSMRNSLLFEALVCDSGQYDRWAQEIAGGEWMGNKVFYQTPLYPYLLGVVYATVGHNVWAIRICQALFGALACVCLARAAARWFSDERVGWLAGVMLALYPPAIFFDGILQKASLDLLLMTALLWAAAVAQQRARPGLLAGIGALLGAMTLNRENAAVLFPVLVTWIGWLAWSTVPPLQPSRAKRFVLWAGAFGLGAAAVLLPVGWRNYHVGNMFALTTSQMGPNFYIGNNPAATGGYETLRADRGDPRYESEDARLLAEQALQRSLTPGEVSRYWLDRSWSYIQSNPAAWIKLLGWKWFLTWNAREMVDAESLRTHEHGSPLLAGLGWVLHFGVVCPLAALGLWWTRRDWRRLWLLYAMLASFAAAVTLFYVFARYRYPLVPVATMFAAAGLAGLWDRLRHPVERNVRELAIGIALAAAVAVFCNWPVPARYRDDAITYYNAGSTFLDMGRTAEAIALLQQAEQADPTFSATFNNLGRAAQLAGDLPQAREYFARAVRLDPEHAVYEFNLATVLLAEGSADQAAEHLRRAIALDSLLAPAYSPLARAYLQRGDFAPAIDLLRQAVALQPDFGTAHAELGVALQAAGHVAEAVEELRAAVQLDPSMSGIANRIATILATSNNAAARNGAAAVRLAEAACQATDHRSPELLATLAAAYAETGQFDRAISVCDEAIALAGPGEMAKTLEAHRERYRAQQPLRAPQ